MSNNISQTPKKSKSIFKGKVSTSLKVEQIVDSFIEFYKQSHDKDQIKRFYKGWLILCPFHDDTKPSLAVYQNGTTWCFSKKCWKPYKLKAVLKAYNFLEEETEEENKELSPNLSKLQSEDWIIIDHKQYFYTDGERTFIRVRVDLENTKTRTRRKEFYFYQPTFKDGEQVLELVRGYVPLILYRLPELEDKEWVFFVEGEKCADALWDLQIPATTLPVGSTLKPSREFYEALIKLKNKIVFILPDNDKGGWAYARMIKQALINLEIEAHIIAVPDLGEKSDIADYIELELLKNKSKDEIREKILSWIEPLKQKKTLQLINSTEAPRLKETLPPREEPLGNFFYPGITLFVGPVKAGKTFFLIQKTFELAKQGFKVVYLALDEGLESFLLKLETLGILEGHPLFYFYTRDDALAAKLPLKLDQGGLEILKKVAETYSPDILVIDIWGNIRPEIQKSKDVYIQDYEAINMLRELSKKIRSIIICHHLKKGDEPDPVHKALGSVGLVGAVDSILILERKRMESRGKLTIVSRYDEEKEFALEFQNGNWKILGGWREVEIAEEQKKILEIIQELGGRATPREIAEALGKNRNTVRVHLARMAQKGLVKRDTTKGTYSVCTVNSVNSVNRVNTVNTVNSPACLHPPVNSKQPCKQLEAPQNQASEGSVYTVYTVYTDNKHETVGGLKGDQGAVYSNKQGCKQEPVQPPDPAQKEFIYLLMPETEKCIRCGCKVWQVDKKIYEKNRGVGACIRCSHLSWFGNFKTGKILNEAEVKYFLNDSEKH